MKTQKNCLSLAEELKTNRYVCTHSVRGKPDDFYGKGGKKTKNIYVNSMHHQCLITDFVDPAVVSVRNFEMAAWTARGLKLSKAHKTQKVCEAFRIKDWNAPILAVQWHPEELVDTELLHNFFSSSDALQLEANGHGN